MTRRGRLALALACNFPPCHPSPGRPVKPWPSKQSQALPSKTGHHSIPGPTHKGQGHASAASAAAPVELGGLDHVGLAVLVSGRHVCGQLLLILEVHLRPGGPPNARRPRLLTHRLRPRPARLSWWTPPQGYVPCKPQCGVRGGSSAVPFGQVGCRGCNKSFCCGAPSYDAQVLFNGGPAR